MLSLQEEIDQHIRQGCPAGPAPEGKEQLVFECIDLRGLQVMVEGTLAKGEGWEYPLPQPAWCKPWQAVVQRDRR